MIRLKLFFSKFRKNLLSETLTYIEFLIMSLWALSGVKVTHVNAHSLSVLPTAVFFRVFKGAKIIYDAHELETERSGLGGARKLVSKWMEQMLMPFVSKVIVVGPSIGAWYEKHYPNKQIYVIRNIPCKIEQSKHDPAVLRNRIGASDETIVFIYQGNLAEGRGIEMLLTAFSATSNVLACGVFMGNGPLGGAIQDAAENSANIFLIPPVEPHQVPAYSCGAGGARSGPRRSSRGACRARSRRSGRSPRRRAP